MATKIQAINTYRPRVKLGRRAEMDELVTFIARSTGLNESGVKQVLLELRDAAIFLTSRAAQLNWKGWALTAPVLTW